MDDNAIYNVILQKLRSAEESEKIRIPLAIESGSRGWGFASPDSDFDCRFVYAHERDWYLTVFDKPDTLECANDKVFDVNGWDLLKFIAHIVKSNAVMFEWLSSNEVYIRDKTITALLWELAAQFFNPISVSHHYLSLAKRKCAEIATEETAKLKKYFYVLRPLANLKFIEVYGKMPYMEYARTLAEIEINKQVASEIARVSEIKKGADESYAIPTNTVLTSYFDAEIARQDERLKTLTFEKNRDYERADTVFRQIIEKAWDNG